MGNLCGIDKKKQSFQQPKLIQQYTINQTLISLISGDIFEEQIEAIVNASDNPFQQSNSTILKKAGPKVQQIVQLKAKLKQGQALYTEAGLLNSKFIIHVALPLWTGGEDGAQKDLLNAREAYLEVFKVAEELQVKSILFTDIQSAGLQVPRIFHANALIMAIFNYLESIPQNNILEQIKIVNSNQTSLRNFEFEFQKRIDQVKNPSLSKIMRDRENEFISQVDGGLVQQQINKEQIQHEEEQQNQNDKIIIVSDRINNNKDNNINANNQFVSDQIISPQQLKENEFNKNNKEDSSDTEVEKEANQHQIPRIKEIINHKKVED